MVACGSPVTTLTQCGGTFADPGGNGNYANSCTVTETICAGTAGQCVTLQFTAFNLENSFDYLRIYNGTSAAAPLLATLTGTTVPGNITSTTGCLTLVFTSDGSVTSTGWLANVICAPCGSPPPPPPGPIVASDCSGAVNICTNSSFQIDPSGSGSVVEFTTGAGSSVSNPLTNPGSTNSGCMLSGELNSTWMVVNIATSGTLEFSIGANGGTGCLDWIMWPYSGSTSCNAIMNNTLAPVRCNYNGLCEGFTGMGTPLPAGGDATSFEPELNVTCGQKFLICLSNYSSQSTSLPLNFFGTATISCSTFTPITVNSATICPGASATLTATGGNTYTWSPGTGLSATTGASVTASPATTTTYTVTGTGSCGTGTATSVVTVLPANDPSCVTTCTATATNTGPYCVGGTIQLNGTGGGTYSWSGPNGFTSTLQNPTLPATAAAAGVYTLTITFSGCTATATTTVVVNPVATANANVDQSVCAGGTVTLAGSVGGGAVSGTWTAPSGSFSNAISLSSTYTPTISTGTVTLTLTTNDPTGPCPAVTDIIVVTVNPTPTINAGIDQTVCAGTAVTLTGVGGSTYSWSPVITNGAPFTPVATTTYTVTGTSAAGCTSTDQVLVTVNPIPTVNAGLDAAVCTGGSTTLTATGATTYTWSPSTGLSGTTTALVTSTPSATITYTVTGTTLGCTSSDAVIVTVNTNAPINAGADVAICAGASTTLTGTGGTTYSWSPGGQTTASITVSPAATTTYTLTGTNAQGCTGTDAVTVTVNPLPIVNAGADQTVCAGTAVTLTASGAATYSWNNSVTNGVAFTPAATTTYTVTGTTTGCIATDQVIVTVNAIPTINAGTDQTVCAGTSVTLTPTGGATYTWSPVITSGVAFVPAATTTYTVTGTSVAGCTSTDAVLVTVNPLPIVNAGADQTVCAGTTVTLTATGASTYTWSPVITNGLAFTPSLGTTTYSVTGTTAAGCIGTDQVVVTVNPNPTPVIQGPTTYCTGNFAVLSTTSTYASYNWSTGVTTATSNATAVNNPITVTVTNTFGCTTTSPAYTVTENSIITANFTETICQGQSAVIHGVTQTTAGVYSQTYTLPTGCDSTSNVTLVVNPLPAVNAGADQAVCTGVATTLNATGASTYTWSPLVTNGIPFTQVIGSTTYTVTGTSAQGCINTDQVVVTVNPLPTVGAGTDQTVCAATAVTLSGSGASTYTWNNSVTNGVAFTPAVTNTYTVTGTDVNGCTNTDQVIVTVNPIPTVGAGADVTICIGAPVTLSGSGAATYTWDNGVTNGVVFNPTATATYTVSGTSAAGCVSNDQVVVTVNPLPLVNAGVDQTVCIGTAVTLSGSGAATYSWSPVITNGVPFTPSVGTVTYTVTGTSAAGCISTDQMVVTVNPLPIVNAGIDQAVCAGEQVTLTASGAATYSWNNGVVNGIAFTPAATTTNTVTGTSAAGCVSTDQVVVTVNPIPNVSAGNDISVCDGQTITLTGSGANIYTWDNSVTNGVAFTPAVGSTTYTVTGTSTAGCINTDQVVVTSNPIPIVTFTPSTTLGCAPLTVNFTNTTANATNCVWTMSDGTVLTGCGTVSNTFEQPGCYDISLTTTDANGCSSSFSAIDLVCVEGAPNASFNPSANVISELNPVVDFQNTTTGASDYVWNFGDTSPTTDAVNPSHDYSENAIGNYLVTLIAYSPLGCSDTTQSVIQIYEELIYYVPNTFTPDYDNFNQTFQPIFTSGFDPYDYTLLIFNRWGEIIFESHDAKVGWNGSYGSGGQIEMVQDGVYTWKIEFKITRNDERKVVIGHVNILR
jgi:gliding motility-associated-like protein